MVAASDAEAFLGKAVPVTVWFCYKDCLVPLKGSISVSYKPVICCQLNVTILNEFAGVTDRCVGGDVAAYEGVLISP
jgi:hypothetical protein